ncbi:class I SAM-dependent methyltransferase [Streptomyces sp. ISL-14]|nr:class I SAM-dependent methyltransferase [Streptomyces sp. ISL-14]
MNDNENRLRQVASQEDPYALSAEYIDIMIAETWRGLAPGVMSVLKGLPATEGPVVDLGAGSGRGVRVIREALPDAPVLAVEPSPAMRAVLLARVHDEPSLRSGVTVLPAAAASVELPDGMRAMLALNVLGHLSPDQRRILWEAAARRLVPGGVVLLNVTPPLHAATRAASAHGPPDSGRSHLRGLGAGRAGRCGPGGLAHGLPGHTGCGRGVPGVGRLPVVGDRGRRAGRGSGRERLGAPGGGVARVGAACSGPRRRVGVAAAARVAVAGPGGRFGVGRRTAAVVRGLSVMRVQLALVTALLLGAYGGGLPAIVEEAATGRLLRKVRLFAQQVGSMSNLSISPGSSPWGVLLPSGIRGGRVL